jgi:hypothetical protein
MSCGYGMSPNRHHTASGTGSKWGQCTSHAPGGRGGRGGEEQAARSAAKSKSRSTVIKRAEAKAAAAIGPAAKAAAVPQQAVAAAAGRAPNCLGSTRQYNDIYFAISPLKDIHSGPCRCPPPPNPHIVFLNDPPASPGVRVVGCGAKQHVGHPIEQWAVGEVGVPRDPAAVRSTPVHVSRTQVKQVLAATARTYHETTWGRGEGRGQ